MSYYSENFGPETHCALDFCCDYYEVKCSLAQYTALEPKIVESLKLHPHNRFLVPNWKLEYREIDGHEGYLQLIPIKADHSASAQYPEFWVPYLLLIGNEMRKRGLGLSYQRQSWIFTQRSDEEYFAFSFSVELGESYLMADDDVKVRVGNVSTGTKIYTLADLNNEKNWHVGGLFYYGADLYV